MSIADQQPVGTQARSGSHQTVLERAVEGASYKGIGYDVVGSSLQSWSPSEGVGVVPEGAYCESTVNDWLTPLPDCVGWKRGLRR